MCLEIEVKNYLMNNLYPPVSEIFIPVALKAILLARKGLFNETVDVPRYNMILTVSNVIDLLLLHRFVSKR